MKRERSTKICRLLNSQESRTAYIRAKLGVLVPSQIRALRLRSMSPPMPRQKDLADETGLHQSRISMFETPGAANVTLDTLANIAAGLRVGLVVEFVPFSKMLDWENRYRQDLFDVTRIEQDEAFINPSITHEARLEHGNPLTNDLTGGQRKEPQTAQGTKKPPSAVAAGAMGNDNGLLGGI